MAPCQRGLQQIEEKTPAVHMKKEEVVMTRSMGRLLAAVMPLVRSMCAQMKRFTLRG